MIILTGASGGIGQIIYPPLLLLEDTLAIYNKTPILNGYKLNLANLEEIKNFVKTIHPSKITLIHLAAVKIDELAIFCDERNWDSVFNINTKGAFFLTKELLSVMTKKGWGRIIWIVSSGLGDIGTITYSASKYALIGMSSVLAREYARYGITSNCLQLGYYKTGMWEKLSKDKQDELINQIPSKKLGNPHNIVNAIKFIMDSPFVNGAVVNIDGGI